ncbi:MAG: NAD(P)/FAD-dependent oxidoreductase [Stellaceae bacterium]
MNDLNISILSGPNPQTHNAKKIIVIGGGPSGLAAALETVRHGAQAIVLERLDKVGGLARTVESGGNRFDIGPHRFFTLNDEVRELFMEICGNDLITVSRLTRIHYRNRYFNYPLTPLSALFGLGIWKSIRVLVSYAQARLRHLVESPNITSFEDWVVDQFGRQLYESFFKSYTEKVWGIPCQSIGADWAAQRIKGLSLSKAIANALFGSKKRVIKTLVDQFMYPRLGAGQLYEKMEYAISQCGGRIAKNTEVRAVHHEGFRVTDVRCKDHDSLHDISGDFFLSSAPLTDLVLQLDPPPPDEILAAARSLRYRNHIGVNLLASGAPPFPDNWIYVHSPDIRMARVADYVNFSKEMATDSNFHPLTVEYFCFSEDDIWKKNDDELFDLAIAELRQMGIVEGRISGSFVVRSEKAYPVIEIGYQEKIETIKTYITQFENLLPIGRSGMFKYNNQDHAIATGLYAARTALGIGKFDPWKVNIDGIYHESGEIGEHATTTS